MALCPPGEKGRWHLSQSEVLAREAWLEARGTSVSELGEGS